MAREDSNDFLAAFGIGAVLGLGAAFLLRPERPDPRRRLLKRVKPHAKQLRRSAKQARKAARRGYRAGTTAAGDAIDHGRELLHEFRGEVERILEEARRELRAITEEAARREEGAGPAPAAEAEG